MEESALQESSVCDPGAVERLSPLEEHRAVPDSEGAVRGGRCGREAGVRRAPGPEGPCV